ncbi:hypothetical protein [Streptomyces sp. CL12-4]|uniref:hypothetical protein n=1 Tax=Streptomyces sp. CL12-4 TaxID=2810306 RepID=UPI001EFB4B16|nr:hypothetical protein [Streptomyces sp. CL12-4]MCG8965267.1 hypothetical protein [Streptomyces sp. CL12-4]
MDEEHVRALESRLRGINATAEIITSSHADVDLTAVLGIGAFDLSHTLAVDPGRLEERDHHHDPGVTSVGVEFHGALDRAASERWLGEPAAARPPPVATGCCALVASRPPDGVREPGPGRRSRCG